MTLTDIPPKERLADSRLNARVPLLNVLWMLERADEPTRVLVQVVAVEAIVGHEVTTEQIDAAFDMIRSGYETGIEVALDDLDPLIDCDGCLKVHQASGDDLTCAHGTFARGCFEDLHHGSDYCPSVGE